jgi:hypothetical protein
MATRQLCRLGVIGGGLTGSALDGHLILAGDTWSSQRGGRTCLVLIRIGALATARPLITPECY